MLVREKKPNEYTEGRGGGHSETHTAHGPSWQCTGKAPWYPGRDLVEGEPRARRAASAQLTLGMGETRRAREEPHSRGAWHLTGMRPRPAGQQMLGRLLKLETGL